MQEENQEIIDLILATFWDKGTEVPLLSQDKGTTGQAKNLAKGRDGPGQPKFRMGRAGTVKIWDILGANVRYHSLGQFQKNLSNFRFIKDNY